MGPYRLGWIRLPKTAPNLFRPGLGGAFGTGLLLSLIIGPCGTPVLASVLSFAAYQQSLVYGGLLLFIYGIGNGLPLVLVGTAAGAFLKRLDGSRFGNWIDPIIGGSLILLGFYLLWRV
jgi:cytochrome c-type biogenesis protein